MSLQLTEVDELKSYFANLAAIEDGDVEFMLFSSLQLPPGCEPAVVDALLCPSPRDGYSSRLFLSAKIAHKGPGQSWNANGVVIAGRQWWAVSWRTNKAGSRLLETLLMHLEAFK